jgi:DivIVA domain-containing protein
VTADGSRFRVAVRGYDRAQVDQYCERIERTLAGTAGADAVTADEAMNTGFDIVVRGYDHDEVEAWVRSTVARLPGALQLSGGPQVSGAPQVSWAELRNRQAEVLRVAERPARERFTRVRLREGYDPDEVDALVDRIRATLATTLTAEEIRMVQFTTVRLRLGYDMQAVDEWLDAVQAAAPR